MSSVTELLRRLVEEQNSPVGALALGVSAFIEYVFPPFPGDFVTVLGAVLVTGYGWNFGLVLGAVMVGSIAGSLVAHQLGIAWARRRALGHGKPRPLLDKIVRRFERHGPAFIVVNRFLPGVRALVFVAAGLAGVPRRTVVLYGGASALLWNLGLMALGAAVGANLDQLQEIVEKYTMAVWTVMVLLAVLVIVKWWRSRRDDTVPK
jgi:membrane protein DedA with SNARE-associated domain